MAKRYRFVLLFFLMFFLSPFLMEAGVLDHLKPVEGKSNVHKMKNIDFIYLINLDQRPEKYEKSIKQLTPYGIIPYRFSAVNGWDLSREEINDLGVKFGPGMYGGFQATIYPTDPNKDPATEYVKSYGQVYFCHCLAQGAMGCTLSHLSCLQDAYDCGYETIWIMEDDIKVVKDPNLISELIEALDKKVGKDKWDILFTDRDIRNSQGNYQPNAGIANRPNYSPKDTKKFYLKKDIDSNFRKIGARFGSHSMIWRRNGIEKILNFYKKYQLYHPYDMDYHLPEGINMYTVQNDVVTNIPGAISDNGAPGFIKNPKEN